MIYHPLSLGATSKNSIVYWLDLQAADNLNVALPADWRPGDDVIVPTAGSCGITKERMANKTEMTCYDWSLCTKSYQNKILIKK